MNRISFEDKVPEELRIDSDEIAAHLSTRLRSYVLDCAGLESAVVGLSGGVDSAVVAYLAKKALGVKRTHLYLLPSESTPKNDIDDAYAVVDCLNIPSTNFKIITIDDYAEKIVVATGIPPEDKLAIGNVKARTRMIMLHSLAHLKKGLVIGTGDKSEITIGYFTKFGDGGVDVLPIGDLYKSQVRQIAWDIDLPSRVYEKPPSPGLWLGQSAESELGINYFLLDQILYRRFDLWLDERSISNELGISPLKVRKIVSQVKATQHKRCPAEIFKVSFRSHGSDLRYPREWL
jgi:NAD+ synthase